MTNTIADKTLEIIDGWNSIEVYPSSKDTVTIAIVEEDRDRLHIVLDREQTIVLIQHLQDLLGLEDELKSAQKAASDAAWERDGDRMGGQFSQEEINRSNEWR